jgi:hypothetical protein
MVYHFFEQYVAQRGFQLLYLAAFLILSLLLVAFNFFCESKSEYVIRQHTEEAKVRIMKFQGAWLA